MGALEKGTLPREEEQGHKGARPGGEAAIPQVASSPAHIMRLSKENCSAEFSEPTAGGTITIHCSKPLSLGMIVAPVDHQHRRSSQRDEEQERRETRGAGQGL